MYNDYKKQFPQIKEITPQKYLALSLEEKNRFVIVDVRSKKEQQISMIPRSLTEEEFNKKKNLYKNKKILVYCTIGSGQTH